MSAKAQNGDELAIGVGFVILTAIITVGRAKRYFEQMNNKLESALTIKQQVAGLVAAGGLTLTATNVISLVGMCLTSAGLVFVYLNWKQKKIAVAEAKRRNDIAASANQIARDKLNFEMQQSKPKPSNKNKTKQKK